MPGVKPAASGGRNLADWHVKGWSATYTHRSQSLARPERQEKLSAGALWPSGAQALASHLFISARLGAISAGSQE